MLEENELTNTQKATWASHIARRALQLMRNEHVIRREAEEGGQLLCVAWTREDRVVLLINPYAVNQSKILTPSGRPRERFLHDLRTVMHGHRTVVTNSRGIFFQVGYWPEPVEEITPLPAHVTLDLADVPKGRLMVPLGVTRRGPKWISLLEADSVLLGGTRQMGKTTLLHGWILSLVTAEEPDDVQLLLCDGKGKAEFGRYAGLPHVHTVAGGGDELAPIVGYLRQELAERSDLLQAHGARHVKELPAADRPPYLVLIVDELAEALNTEGVEDALSELVSLGGAFGVLPVLATQRPDSSMIAGFLKANLATRISLPVPTRHDSSVILGRSGADKIAKLQGRILLEWAGRMVEAQAYDVPTQLLNDTLDRMAEGSPVAPPLGLEAWQVRLVRAAIEQLDGAFHIRELARITGISRRQVEDLAPAWERQQLLTPAGYDDDGQRTPRRVTPKLRGLAETGV